MIDTHTWRAAVLAGSQQTELVAETLRIGGSLKIQGSPDAVSALARQVNENLEPTSRRLLLSLDLEGWEPGDDDLLSFARYRAERTGAELAEADTKLAADQGLVRAAVLSLILNRDFPENIAVAAATDRPSFVELLIAWAEQYRLAILVADHDTVPWPLRLALQEAQERSSIACIEGVSGDGAVKAGIELDEASSLEIDRRLVLASQDELTSDSVEHRTQRVLEAFLLLETPVGLELLLIAEAQSDSWSEDVREAVIDHLDDFFVDELRVLEDLGFLHPAFEQSTYCTADPAVVFRWRQRMNGGVSELASHWLDTLRPILPTQSRATTVLLLRLSDLAFGPQGQKSKHLRRRLEWWMPSHELDADAASRVENGDLTDQELVALIADRILPAEIRELFLNAQEKRGVTPKDAGAHLLYKALLLAELKRPEQALEIAREGLEWSANNRGRESEPFLSAQILCAQLMAEQGELAAARDELLSARELAGKVLAADDTRRIALASDLGEITVRIGELRGAREPLTEAADLAVDILGPQHPLAMVRRNNLASLLIDIGELEEARALLQATLRDASKSAANKRWSAALFHNLQSVTLQLKPHHRQTLEELLNESRRLFGEHPNQIPLLAQLTELFLRQGHIEQARSSRSQALELAALFQEVGDPEVFRLAQALEALDIAGDEA